MPIEIKELHIRVAVTAGGPPTTPSLPAGAPSTTPAGDTDTVVAACVEQVMQLLHDRTER
jgi:hypothetical protein